MKRVEDLNIQELEVFHSLSESQLFHYFEPELGYFIAESKNVILRAINGGYEPVRLLIEEKVIETSDGKEVLEAVGDIEIFYAPKNVLLNITGYNLTCGLLCLFKRREIPTLDTLLKDARRVVILENVVNSTNVGSIFRNAAALGFDAVLLTHDSADPLYRRASRVSMGNVFNINYGLIDNPLDVKNYGFKTVSMALRHNTIDINDKGLKEEEKLAIIMGSEGPGLKNTTIDNSDYVVKIPMSNTVDSLNVSAASAIALYVLSEYSD